MIALVKTQKGPGFIEVRDVPVPAIREDDWVLIEVKAAGVCGTDLHIWHDQFTYWPPVVLGHEFSGVIVDVGPKVRKFRVGDPVVAEPHSLACGMCANCRQGRIQLCEYKRSPGWGIDGAFADYVTMPEKLLHRIPDGVSWELAALAEPMAITVHQVAERARIECQDVVVVTGSGPIGIMAVFVAKAMGAGKVIVTGVDTCEFIRFDAARRMGADVVVNVQRENVRDIVMNLTDGQGADLVVETSGAAPAIAQTVDLVRKFGRISCIGLCSSEMPGFPWNRAMMKSIDVLFNMSSYYTAWDRALGLLQKYGNQLESLITHRVSIDQWENTFKELEAERGIKALFIPDKISEPAMKG
jgi:L-iditol 2-dehydrogenase